jgi:hypothetical protein
LKDFTARDNTVIYNTGLDAMEQILGELRSTAPSELRETIWEIESRIGDIRLCLKKNESEMSVKELAVKFAIGAGVQFTLLCAKLGLARGDGQPENPIWDYVRKIFADNPSTKKRAICNDAILALKKDRPRARKPTLDYLVKHFSKHVKKTCHV